MDEQKYPLELILIDGNGLARGKWSIGSHLNRLTKGVAMPVSVFGLDQWGREVLSTGVHADSGDPDALCFPVEGRIDTMPWRDDGARQVLLEMKSHGGGTIDIDPRGQLGKRLSDLSMRGLRATVAFELEFYLTPPASEADSADEPNSLFSPEFPEASNLYDLEDLSGNDGFLENLLAAAEEQGLPISGLSAEGGEGQYEINLNHRSDPLAAADDAVLIRRLVMRMAESCGRQATFMAKPRIDWPGSGMHVHVSLQTRDGRNAFAGAEGEILLKKSVAALLALMPETLLCYCGGVNGMRRFGSGSAAPSWASWGYDNRSVAVRLPRADSTNLRFEHRMAAANANPYLVLCALISAILAGLDEPFPLPPEVELNAHDMSASSTDYLFPATFSEALKRFSDSSHCLHYFGEPLHRVHLELKRAELQAFERYISPLEYNTYS